MGFARGTEAAPTRRGGGGWFIELLLRRPGGEGRQAGRKERRIDVRRPLYDHFCRWGWMRGVPLWAFLLWPRFVVALGACCLHWDGWMDAWMDVHSGQEVIIL